MLKFLHIMLQEMILQPERKKLTTKSTCNRHFAHKSQNVVKESSGTINKAQMSIRRNSTKYEIQIKFINMCYQCKDYKET